MKNSFLLGFFLSITLTLLVLVGLLSYCVNKLGPVFNELLTTYNNICKNGGIVVDLKAGTLGRYDVIGKVPNKDRTVLINLPCGNTLINPELTNEELGSSVDVPT